MVDQQQKAFFVIQQAATLLQMPRAHKRTLWTAFDTIASHSYHVATIAYILCKLEWLSDEDAQRGCSMAVFHDLAEARTGDHDFISKKYNICDEEKAVSHQFANCPWEEWLKDLLHEREARETHISLCVKDADHLAQIYHEWVLMWQGNALAKQWFEGDQEKRVPFMKTRSAKDLAKLMLTSNPNERWWHEFVENNYSQKDLTWEI